MPLQRHGPGLDAPISPPLRIGNPEEHGQRASSESPRPGPARTETIRRFATRNSRLKMGTIGIRLETVPSTLPYVAG